MKRLIGICLFGVLTIAVSLFDFPISSRKAGAGAVTQNDINQYVSKYQILVQTRMDALQRAKEFDRMSRNAMAAGDMEMALEQLKRAIAVLEENYPIASKTKGQGPPSSLAKDRPETRFSSDESSPFGFEPASVIPPPEYGIRNPYDLALDLGAKWDRSLRFIWTMTQPDLSREQYDWRQDNQLTDIPKDLIPVANILIGIPQDDPKYFLYAKENSFLPRNEYAYVRFVNATVERYDGDGQADMPGLKRPIKYWQVDNEPPHGLKHYAEFLRITSQAIRKADPQAKVIIGGVPGMPPVSEYLDVFDKFYLPFLDELAQLQGNFFDIFDFHWYGDASGDYRDARKVYDHIKARLDERGLSPLGGYWITEMGTYSGDPIPVAILNNYDYPFQSEKQQAIDLVKRYVYPLSFGIEKIFLSGIKEGRKYDEGYFDFTGLVYDGRYRHDRGKGVKKLAFFTYKNMVDVLEGSEWKDIEAIINGEDNLYVYKFPRKDGEKPVYVLWWDYFDEPGYVAGNTKKCSFPINAKAVKVHSALTDSAGNTRSWVTSSESGKIEIQLNDEPLFLKPID